MWLRAAPWSQWSSANTRAFAAPRLNTTPIGTELLCCQEVEVKDFALALCPFASKCGFYDSMSSRPNRPMAAANTMTQCVAPDLQFQSSPVRFRVAARQDAKRGSIESWDSPPVVPPRDKLNDVRQAHMQAPAGFRCRSLILIVVQRRRKPYASAAYYWLVNVHRPEGNHAHR
jgi:hypothetical protein